MRARNFFRFFSFLFLLGMFLPATIVFAATSCTCTTADKDCSAITLNAGQQSQAACETLCKTNAGTNYASASYTTDTTASDADLYKCNAAHQTFVASKKTAATSSAAPATPPLATITPTLNVPIPNVSFTSAVSKPCSFDPGQTCIDSNFIADYLNGVYNFLIGSGLIIVIVVIMVGGLQYTLGAGSPNMVGKGKKRITDAVTGLVLLLAAYLILHTINPQLTTLKMVEQQNIQAIDMPEVDEGDVVPDGQSPPSGGLPTPGRLCHSIADCQKICDDKSSIAKYNINVPLLVASNGFKNPGKARGTAALQAALKEAGNIAVATNPNYTLVVPGSECGYRSVLAQVNKACADIKNNGGHSLTHGILAWPGGSNHGSGVAIDIQLENGGKNLMVMSAKAESAPQFKEPADILAKIMGQAGFVRYGKEIWHFELKSGASSYCRCSYPNCPFPPHC